MANHNKIVTPERIEEIRPVVEDWCNHWISYPDLFIDLIIPENSEFKLFFYQRIFLRACMRFRYFYATFCRAFSKSFLSIFAMYLRCMFLPGSKLFVCADVKEQAAKIASEKIHELWDKFPMLANELDYTVGSKPKFGSDYVRLIFKNGSQFDVVGAANSARGGRRHGQKNLSTAA